VLLDLLDDLLNLAKLESGRMEFSFHLINIESCVKAQVRAFAALAAEKHLSVQLSAAPGLPAVFADRSRIDQVVRNLLSNAIKFSPEYGTITVDVTCSDQTVRIEVADQGPGIPESELDLIFEKFAQSSATCTAAGGTGLGLAISREIMTAHGGDIQAANQSPNGSRFTISLPAHKTQPGTGGSRTNTGPGTTGTATVHQTDKDLQLESSPQARPWSV
jgi:signal transduction histidine kinase